MKVKRIETKTLQRRDVCLLTSFSGRTRKKQAHVCVCCCLKTDNVLPCFWKCIFYSFICLFTLN